MGGACSEHGEMRNGHKMLVRMRVLKGPLGRPRRTWEECISGEQVGKLWIGQSRLRIGASGGLL
jgi:hypothetical protein